MQSAWPTTGAAVTAQDDGAMPGAEPRVRSFWLHRTTNCGFCSKSTITSSRLTDAIL